MSFFRVIRCTCDFSEIRFSQRCFFYAFSTKTFCRCSLWQSTQKLLFSSAWPCQQRSCMVWGFVRRLSSVRPSSVSQLSQNLLGGILSNFSCCLPWAIRPDVFFEVLKKNSFSNFSWCFSVSLTWDPMGAKTSKRCSSLKLISNFLNLSWVFFTVDPTKVLFGFLNLWFTNFDEWFWGNFTFTLMSYRETKNCCYLEKESS